MPFTEKEIQEADVVLRSRLRTLFWRKGIHYRCQTFDDVAQECWLVMLERKCLTRPFIFTVAKLVVARFIERRERKKEKSYHVPDVDGKFWVRKHGGQANGSQRPRQRRFSYCVDRQAKLAPHGRGDCDYKHFRGRSEIDRYHKDNYAAASIATA